MPDWVLFAGVTTLLSVAFVLLARASARAVNRAFDTAVAPADTGTTPLEPFGSSWVLAGNVIASHGVLIVLLLGTAWYARVPVASLGVDRPSLSTLGLGVSLGIALAVANAGTARLASRVGLDYDERLRTLLAPESTAGWITLLVVVLPLVAIAEELLFRGALVGGLPGGLGLPIWTLAVVSSVLFGLGHGLQGTGGILAATGLGAVFAATFVLTGSLTVVVVAHYVVNALEFLVTEWLGWEA